MAVSTYIVLALVVIYCAQESGWRYHAPWRGDDGSLSTVGKLAWLTGFVFSLKGEQPFNFDSPAPYAWIGIGVFALIVYAQAKRQKPKQFWRKSSAEDADF